MARDRVSIDQFPGAVMAQLEEYVSMASDEVKEAVRTVSEDVKALGELIRLQSGKVIPNSMGIHSLEEQPEPLHG